MTAPRGPLLIALVLSLTANLFLLSFGAARWYHARHDDDSANHAAFWRRNGGHGRGPGPGRELLRGAFEQRRPELRARRQQLREAQRAVQDALNGEPFDPPALDQALERLRQATAESQQLMHEALKQVAPSLSREQRAQLAHSGPMLGGFLGPREGPEHR